MEFLGDNYLIILGLVLVLILWLIPAFLLTLRIRKIENLNPSMKKQLIAPMWLVPAVGNIVCFMVISNIGELPKLSAAEHRSIWVALWK